jgi:hypothetical protein
MGNAERRDKTLPVSEMIFYVRRDAALRDRFTRDLEGLAREFGLSRQEYEAFRDKDSRARVHHRARRRARLHARGALAVGNQHGGFARCQELAPRDRRPADDRRDT